MVGMVWCIRTWWVRMNAVSDDYSGRGCTTVEVLRRPWVQYSFHAMSVFHLILVFLQLALPWVGLVVVLDAVQHCSAPPPGIQGQLYGIRRQGRAGQDTKDAIIQK